MKSVGAAGWQPYRVWGRKHWHQKSSVGSNVGAVGCQPTGFEDGSIGIKRAVLGNLCLLKSVGAVGWQPTGFEDGSIGIKRAVVGPTCVYLSL